MSSAISFGDANHDFQAGIIHGPVNTTFQLPPERPETPPRPSAVIPFGRDTDFVEREIFDQIQAKYAAPGSRTALVGLGGVGAAEQIELRTKGEGKKVKQEATPLEKEEDSYKRKRAISQLSDVQGSKSPQNEAKQASYGLRSSMKG